MTREVIPIVPNTSDYYSSTYWNNYTDAISEINRRISGDPAVSWQAHFYRSVSQRRFRKALFLLCGKGWLERHILRQFPLFEEAVGIDYSDELLSEARAEGAGLPIRYYQMDINTAALPEGDFDLVVNLAACHHIAYLDRVLRKICEVMSPDGYFVSFDYVGPHRNQYPYSHWNASWELNRRLPPHLRGDMDARYPHLPTMLHVDPTEAIHSELILDVTGRYFRFEEHKHAGGPVAYEVLLNNANMHKASPEEQGRWVKFVMDADQEFLHANPGSSYFDYFACRPRKEALQDRPTLERHESEENRREAEAQNNGGLYYEHSLLQNLYLNLADKTVAADHRLISIRELQERLHQLEE